MRTPRGSVGRVGLLCASLLAAGNGMWSAQPAVASSVGTPAAGPVPTRQQVQLAASERSRSAAAQAAARRKRAKGALRVRVRGVPAGSVAKVRVRGPRGYRRDLRATALLRRLRAGTYRVSARAFAKAGGVTTVSVSRPRVTVRSGRTSGVVVRYRWRARSPYAYGATGIDSRSPVEVFGNWIVGFTPYDSLAGYNYRTGARWIVDPYRGLAGIPQAPDELGRFAGRVVVPYDVTIPGQGIYADRELARVVSLDPATGRRLSQCQLAWQNNLDSAGNAWTYGVLGGVQRIDPTTCVTQWPKPQASMSPWVDAGSVWLVDTGDHSDWPPSLGSIVALNAATGSVLWSFDAHTGGPEVLGLWGGAVVIEDSDVSFWRVGTGTPVGRRIGVSDVWVAGDARLDPSDGVVYYLRDGTLSAFAPLGQRGLWSISGVYDDVNGVELDIACSGRLWIYDGRDSQDYVLKRNSGGVARPVRHNPQRCLDANVGLYEGDPTLTVAALP